MSQALHQPDAMMPSVKEAGEGLVEQELGESLELGFYRHSQCLTTVKLLGQLTQALQKHRGACMAFLSGDQAFLPMLARLQKYIGRLLEVLKGHNGRNELIGSASLRNIDDGWQTILMGWQDDDILLNFEFHGHLVDSIKQVMRGLMRDHLMYQLSDSGKSCDTLLHAIIVQIPEVIELVARLRGLSTNAAVVKACGADSHARISFLIKEIPQQNDRLLEVLEELQSVHGLLPRLQAMKALRMVLQRYLISVQVNILESKEISADSVELFNSSTEIVDALWQAVDEGLQMVESLVFRQLSE